MICRKKQLDFELYCMEHPETFCQNTGVKKRIAEALKTLDEAYGADRKAHDMGGYVFLFLSEENFNAEIGRIMEHYNLNKDYAEYCETIEQSRADDGLLWIEELYLLSSDDSILMIHPMKAVIQRETAQKGA